MGARCSAARRRRSLAAAAAPLLLLASIALGPAAVHAIEIEASKATAPDGVSVSPKCLSEELHASAISLIQYEADAPVVLKVFHPNSTVLHESRDQKSGHWGFMAPQAGEFKACFEYDVIAAKAATIPPVDPPAGGAEGAGQHVRIQVDWKTGIAAKDWEAVAKREHLTEITAALTEVEHELRHVYSQMMLMREREEEMRNTSERVNARVAWMSVTTLSISGVLSVWQVLHMRAYFKKKKII